MVKVGSTMNIQFGKKTYASLWGKKAGLKSGLLHKALLGRYCGKSLDFMWKVLLFVALVVSYAHPIAAAHETENAPYPNRPVRLVVPFTIGGSADNYARLLAHKLTGAWNQQIIIDNRPGSNGIIGTEVVAKAPADGYTLLLGNIGNIANNPVLYKRLPYKVSDFSPVSLIASSPFVMLVPLALQVNTLKEFLALAKAKPGELNYASTGKGSPGHLSAELFAQMADIKMVHVAYRSHGITMSDIASGQVHLWFNGIAPAQVQLKGGKVRAIAVTSAKRARVMPNIPTIAESGVPGYEFIGWYGILTPKGTPQPVIQKLNTDIVKVLRQPDVQERFLVDGAEPVGNESAQFALFIEAEMKKAARLVKLAGIEPD